MIFCCVRLTPTTKQHSSDIWPTVQQSLTG